MNRQPEFTAVYVVPDLGHTPASVNRKTGELYINRAMWCQLKPEHRVFVLLHEMGHLAHNTTNEFLADSWAFTEYAKKGYSLQEAVKALSRVLSGNSPEHNWRIYLQLMRAADHDFKVNGNKDIYSDMAGYLGHNYAGLLHFAGTEDEAAYMEYATGKKSRREYKQERKDDRTQAKIERKDQRSEAKAYRKETQADTNYILADKYGINARAQNIQGALSGIADVAKGVGSAVMMGSLGGAAKAAAENGSEYGAPQMDPTAAAPGSMPAIPGYTPTGTTPAPTGGPDIKMILIIAAAALALVLIVKR